MSGGLVQKVSPEITIPNGVPFSMNLEYDKVLGEAVSRKGTSIIGSQMDGGGDPCLGLYHHIDTTAANSKLFAGFGTSIYDVIGTDAEVTSLTASAKQRYTTFINATLMLNGNQARSYTNAGGWISTGGVFDLANIPANAKFPIEFKDRVYCVTTDLLNYTTTPTAGTVSWVNSGSGSIYVEREDGGGTIQGLNKTPGYLMIYKQRSLKRWNFDSAFPEDLVNIGTQSNESIVRARGKNFFFYGPNGFYETDGRFPKLISRPVQRIIEGMSSSFYEHVNGWSDDFHIYWSIGDVTVDFDRGFTETYTNVVLRYTLDTQQWATMRYNHKFRFMSQYISGTDTLLIGGDSDGQVLQLNTGTTDYASTPVPITYILESPEFDFGFREYKKTIADRIFVHSDNTRGAEIQCRINYGEWKSFGNLKDIVTEVQIKTPMNGHIFQFRVVDSISGHIIKIRGIDFPNIDVHTNVT
jgi:hypothetical protein